MKDAQTSNMFDRHLDHPTHSYIYRCRQCNFQFKTRLDEDVKYHERTHKCVNDREKVKPQYRRYRCANCNHDLNVYMDNDLNVNMVWACGCSSEIPKDTDTMNCTQILVAFAKYIDGERPHSVEWTKEDQEVYEYAIKL